MDAAVADSDRLAMHAASRDLPKDMGRLLCDGTERDCSHGGSRLLADATNGQVPDRQAAMNPSTW
jgi:hypothetical protein